jgi:ribosomal protein S18 acetylase RimI-like enzyme
MPNTALEEFWSGLELELGLVPATTADASRIAHISAQSGAFNLGPDGRDEQAFAALLAERDSYLWLIRVKDRYDDYGVAGVVGAAALRGIFEVHTLVLNCRVLGKGVEFQVLEEVLRVAEERGFPELTVRCHRTARNALATEFVRRLGARRLREEANGLSCTIASSAISGMAKSSAASAKAPPPSQPRHDFSPQRFVRSRWFAVSPRERTRIIGDIALSLRREEQLLDEVAARKRTARIGEHAEYVPPRTALEEVLCGIWADVLGVERVGVHDHFFQLGGHSLLAVQVISRIRETLETHVVLQDVFQTPTVAALAGSLSPESGNRQQLEHRAKLLIRVARMSEEDTEIALSQRVPTVERER